MKLSNVGNKYGAPMGRVARHVDRNVKVQLFVHHCPLTDGGYDEGGAYWGEGQPMWRAVDPDGAVEFFMRAEDRHAAIDCVYEQYPKAAILDTPRERWFEEFVMGYMECALWATTYEREGGGETLAPETEAKMREDCKDFVDASEPCVHDAIQREHYTAEMAGHDLWLTRNGHGVGYWDRGLGAVGRKLTEVAQTYAEVDLYVGDDGLVYQM